MDTNIPGPKFSDHDLLIRLDTKMESLTDEVRLMRDGTKDDIKAVKDGKLEKDAFNGFIKEMFNPLAKRVEVHNRLIYIGMGIVLFAQFIILIIIGIKG